ncbi:MAG TPA: pyridoxal 5'-phosphate synthase glutaminase subunit PdxT [Vicinamibacteria bacterium]
MMRVAFGVLALQGGFAAHLLALREVGAVAREVRRPHELEGLAGLVIPGGESTALLRLMALEDQGPHAWFDALARFHRRGGVLLGTCAGAILLAREVRPRQPSLGLLDATLRRNAYGRQTDSFEGVVAAPTLGGRLPAVFIRAPRFETLGQVEVLATHGDEPVLVQQGRIVAATFHPELTASRAVHTLVVGLAAQADVAKDTPRGAVA